MTAREWLDAAQARADAATKGPWEYAAETEEIVSPDGGIVEMTWPGRNRANATFIAHARTDAPALVAALRAVLDEVDRLQGWADNNRSTFADGVPLSEVIYHDAYSTAARNLRDAVTAALDGAS